MTKDEIKSKIHLSEFNIYDLAKVVSIYFEEYEKSSNEYNSLEDMIRNKIELSFYFLAKELEQWS